MHRISLIFILFYSVCYGQITDFDTVNFDASNRNADRAHGAKLNNLPHLVHQLTHGLPSEVTKFNAIYRWICHNIASDLTLHSTIQSYRQKYQRTPVLLQQKNREFNKIVFKKLVSEKKTICTGYAYLLKKMANSIGIPCVIVHGYARSVDANSTQLNRPNHSWNAVKLAGKWYLCDPTWSSGYFVGNDQFIADYNPGYFLTDPKKFAQNHDPIHKKWLLLAEPLSRDFTALPFVYDPAFKLGIHPITPNKLYNRYRPGKRILFKISATNHLNTADLKITIDSQGVSKTLNPERISKRKNILSFEVTPPVNTSFELHISYQNELLTTYAFSPSAVE
ncbi:conserved hypothetical protein [Tenacibaculum litopenaei]|uniref:transglutaminase domain-containing protein n=1 Tax=Tenacibaculum litopenaei TaxID=396016 RepID=UPI003894C4EE